jgi:hypothetical protein
MRIEFYPDPDPDPDPLVRGKYPRIRIRIRTKMSRIPNTACRVRSFYRMNFDLDRGLIYEISLILREKTEIENCITFFEKRKSLL